MEANAHGDGDGDGDEDEDGMLTRPNNQAMKTLPVMAENRFSNGKTFSVFFYYALFLSLSLSLSSVQNFVCLIRVLPHKVEREGEGEGNKANKVSNRGERGRGK